MRARWMLSAAACAAGLLAAAQAAQAAVQVGSSGWLWGNPLPQGNTIRALSFAGAQGYAAGDFGTLLHTTDARRDVDRPAERHLHRAHRGAGDRRRLGLRGRRLRRAALGRRRHDVQAPRLHPGRVELPRAARRGLVREPGDRLPRPHRRDRPAHRQRRRHVRPAQPAPRHARPGRHARCRRTSCSSSDQAGLAATSDGHVYRTVDGASSWTLVSTTDRAVRSLDVRRRAARRRGRRRRPVPDDRRRRHDLDPAGPRHRRPRPRQRPLRRARRAAWRRRRRGAQLVRIDSAEAAPQLVTPSPDPVFAAAFASPTRIVVGGATGATAVSDDAGRTFAPVGGRLTGRFLGMRAGGQAGAAFAPGENGTLAKTVDGGQTWTRGNVSTSEDVFDVSFPTNLAGFALDTAGGLFRTRDGGATWRPLDTGSTQNAQAVVAPSPTTVLLAGPRGLRRSTDGGDTFSAIGNRSSRARACAGIDVAGGTLVAWGPRALFRSLRPRPDLAHGRPPGPRDGRPKVDFVDARDGLLARGPAAASAARATAAGAGRELLGVGTSDASGMAWSSATRGYLVIRPLRRRREPVRVPAAHDRRRRDMAPAVRRLDADPGERDRGRPRRRRLPARRRRGPAVLAQRRRRGAREPVDPERPRRRVSRPSTITVTGRLSPAAGQRAGDGQHAARRARRAGSTRRSARAANGAFTTSWRVAPGDDALRRAVGRRLPQRRRRLRAARRAGGAVAAVRPRGGRSRQARRAARSSASGGSRARSPGRSSSRKRAGSARRSTRISGWPKRMPMHVREPPPNGHVGALGDAARRCLGREALGPERVGLVPDVGQAVAGPRAVVDRARRRAPAGRRTRTARRERRGPIHAGGYRRSVSSTHARSTRRSRRRRRRSSRVARQLVEEERDRRGRRVVAGEQQRHDLVADVLRRQAAAVLVARRRAAARGCPRRARPSRGGGRSRRRSARRAARARALHPRRTACRGPRRTCRR